MKQLKSTKTRTTATSLYENHKKINIDQLQISNKEKIH